MILTGSVQLARGRWYQFGQGSLVHVSLQWTSAKMRAQTPSYIFEGTMSKSIAAVSVLWAMLALTTMMQHSYQWASPVLMTMTQGWHGDFLGSTAFRDKPKSFSTARSVALNWSTTFVLQHSGTYLPRSNPVLLSTSGFSQSFCELGLV